MRKYFNSRKTVLAFVLVPIFSALITSCSSGKAKEKNEMPKAVSVTAVTVMQKDVPLQIRAIGNVEAYSTVSIKAQVGGELSKVYFKEGDYVKKGDLLFLIDPRPFEAALKQAEANLAKDTIQALNASMNAKRYAKLVEKGYVSIEQYDQMRTNADALNAIVKADKAALENARLQLEYCYIRAPIDGRTGSLMVHQGNIVRANADTPMVVINQIMPIYANFSIPETRLLDIRKYMALGRLKVEAIIPKSETPPAAGELTFVDNAVNPATGTITLKATFPNKERALWPGQFVNVVLILTTKPNATVIPSQAVQTGQMGTYVFVVRQNMTADIRSVVTGISYNGEVVIEKGLQPGEKVVTDGQLQLSPGKKVMIKNLSERFGR